MKYSDAISIGQLGSFPQARQIYTKKLFTFTCHRFFLRCILYKNSDRFDYDIEQIKILQILIFIERNFLFLLGPLVVDITFPFDKVLRNQMRGMYRHDLTSKRPSIYLMRKDKRI